MTEEESNKRPFEEAEETNSNEAKKQKTSDEDIQSSKKCDKHSLPKQFYCLWCSKLICGSCAFIHTVCNETSSLEESPSAIGLKENILLKLADVRAKLDEEIGELVKKMDELRQSHRKGKLEIKSLTKEIEDSKQMENIEENILQSNDSISTDTEKILILRLNHKEKQMKIREMIKEFDECKQVKEAKERVSLELLELEDEVNPASSNKPLKDIICIINNFFEKHSAIFRKENCNIFNNFTAMVIEPEKVQLYKLYSNLQQRESEMKAELELRDLRVKVLELESNVLKKQALKMDSLNKQVIEYQKMEESMEKQLRSKDAAIKEFAEEHDHLKGLQVQLLNKNEQLRRIAQKYRKIAEQLQNASKAKVVPKE